MLYQQLPTDVFNEFNYFIIFYSDSSMVKDINLADSKTTELIVQLAGNFYAI